MRCCCEYINPASLCILVTLLFTFTAVVVRSQFSGPTTASVPAVPGNVLDDGGSTWLGYKQKCLVLALLADVKKHAPAKLRVAPA